MRLCVNYDDQLLGKHVITPKLNLSADMSKTRELL